MNKYRPCADIKNLYNLVMNVKTRSITENELGRELIGCKLHIKRKGLGFEYYLVITGIYIEDRIIVAIDGTYHKFDELFNNYEIEVAGECLPFGVEDD